MTSLYEWNNVSKKYVKAKVLESSILYLTILSVSFFIYLMDFHIFLNYLTPYLTAFITIWFLIYLATIKPFYRSIAFKCTQKFFLYESGFFIRKEISIPCQKVYQIKIKQGPILKRLDLVSLEIITAVNSLEIDFIELETAESFRDYVEKYGGGNEND